MHTWNDHPSYVMASADEMLNGEEKRFSPLFLGSPARWE